MRHCESDVGSHTSNPPPILRCPAQTRLHAGLGHVQGMRRGAGSGRPPASPPPGSPPQPPTQPTCRSPAAHPASPAACWSRVRCSLQHLQRATQRCRSSTSDRRLSVCLRPHALDENSIRSEEELTMMQMPWDAMSSSAKTFGSLRTATQALQGSAQVGNIVRRGNKGGGSSPLGRPTHQWS